jgi:hypothetical protein
MKQPTAAISLHPSLKRCFGKTINLLSLNIKIAVANHFRRQQKGFPFMNDVIASIVLFVALFAVLVGTMYLKVYFLKHSVLNIARDLREQGAVDAAHAMTPQELGLNVTDLSDQAYVTHPNYSSQAMAALTSAEIVCVLEDGRIYLDEEKLHKTFINTSAVQAIEAKSRNYSTAALPSLNIQPASGQE